MKTILLIEDNADVRENTTEMLDLAGYQVITAMNGKEGVEKAKRHIPDLIICDIMMPELDGYGVLGQLNSNKETVSIPFIFLTAKSERSDMRKGMSQGADDYITKPFEEKELLDAVEARLKRSELMKADYQKSADGIESFISNAQSINDLNTISKSRSMHLFKRKQIVYNEGLHPRGIYFIQKGKVKSYKSNEDGKEYILGLYNEGDFFGYLALLEDRIYTDNAETIDESEIYFIPKEDFFNLIQNNKEVANRFIKMLSNNIAEMEDRILKLAYNSVRKRVAEALLFVEKTYNDRQIQNYTMMMSREDIAGIVGTSTETVIRALSDFKDENIIDIKGRSITITNMDKLRKMRN
jgi:CRP-like cAMP-binding protein/FixJ family two-component response regulator